MDKIIQKAIDGGYEPFTSKKYADLDKKEVLFIGDEFIVDIGVGLTYRKNIRKMFMEAEFWRAIGKSLNWKDNFSMPYVFMR